MSGNNYRQASDTKFEYMAKRLPNVPRIQALIGYQPSMDLMAILKMIVVDERAPVTSSDLHYALGGPRSSYPV